jgi:AsmA protein
MKRRLQIVGMVCGVIVAAMIALPFGVNINSFRPQLETELSAAIGRPVRVGNLGLSFFARTVSAQDLTIGDDPGFSQQPFVRAKELKVGVEILPMIFSRSLHVTELTLDRPEIALLRSASGTWNFSSLGGSLAASPAMPAPAPLIPANPPPPSPAAAPEPSPAGRLAVKKLEVKDGRITIGGADSTKTHVYDNVSIAVRDFAFDAQFPFTFSAHLPSGGSLTLAGNAGPINPTDASLTPLQARVSVQQLDLAAAGIAELSPGISGLANFEGTVTSDGQEVKTSGQVGAEKLKLVQSGAPAGRPVQVKYAVQHELHSQSGTLTAGDIAMGRAVAQMTGTYQIQGDSARLNLKLNAQNMPVDDLEAMLPALGVVLPSGSQLRGGTLSANLDITGTADDPVIAGSIRLSNSKLAGFDLGSKLSSISKLSGAKTGLDTSIENLSTEARVAADGVRSDKINLKIPALGVLTGSGTISPGGAMQFKMTALLNGAIATAVTKLAGLGDQGESVPFFIRGTTSKPSFEPDVKGMLTGQVGDQLKDFVKKRLQKKAPQNGQPNRPQPHAMPKNQPQNQPQTQHESVMKKLKGLLHRKKKN